MNRYRCMRCGHWFAIDHRPAQEPHVPLWIQYIDGASFRSIGDEYNIAPAAAYNHITAQMNRLPDNTWLSYQYCNRWSGILHIDGKYVPVLGYAKKIPFIWSVDYLQHDFPTHILAPSENSIAFDKLARQLKAIRYPVQLVVSDDVEPLRMAFSRHFPRVRFQLCHTHYIENIRQQLHIRTDDRYHRFFNALLTYIFVEPVTRTQREAGILRVLEHHTNNDAVLQSVIVDIAKNYDLLFAFEHFPAWCPRTNNIIECFNSHLKGRLKTIKRFQSFHAAARFLNAYVIRRRTKPFTDCDDPFKHFNGKLPLQNSIKKQAPWPDILGVPDPRPEQSSKKRARF